MRFPHPLTKTAVNRMIASVRRLAPPPTMPAGARSIEQRPLPGSAGDGFELAHALKLAPGSKDAKVSQMVKHIEATYSVRNPSVTALGENVFWPMDVSSQHWLDSASESVAARLKELTNELGDLKRELHAQQEASRQQQRELHAQQDTSRQQQKTIASNAKVLDHMYSDRTALAEPEVLRLLLLPLAPAHLRHKPTKKSPPIGVVRDVFYAVLKTLGYDRAIPPTKKRITLDSAAMAKVDPKVLLPVLEGFLGLMGNAGLDIRNAHAHRSPSIMLSQSLQAIVFRVANFPDDPRIPRMLQVHHAMLTVLPLSSSPITTVSVQHLEDFEAVCAEYNAVCGRA